MGDVSLPTGQLSPAVSESPAGARPCVDPLVPTVFHEPWWLEAAAGGSYEAVEVTDGHRVVGRFPFCLAQRFGMNISRLPMLTHFLGPAVYEGSGSENTRFLQRYTITNELIAKLPRCQRFWHKLHRGYPESLSFQTAGFETGVQFTFEIKPRAEAEVWSRMRNKTRNVIRRAQEEFEVTELKDFDSFLHFYQKNLAARGKKMVFDAGRSAAIYAASAANKAGQVLCIRNAKNELVAGMFMVWDARSGYYLMSTRSETAGNGAISLLIWTGIRFCLERGLIFDFDGIGDQGSILLFVGFGGEVKTRYTITGETTIVKLADLLRRSVNAYEPPNRFSR